MVRRRRRSRFASPANPGVSPTVVAFVQDTRNGDVLQALAAPDCRDP